MNIMKKVIGMTLCATLGMGEILPVEAQNTEALNRRQQAIVSIAAFTAKGDMKNLSAALNKGLDNGLTVNEIKEVLTHLYAYIGFPRSLNGINCFMSVLKDRTGKGIADETGKEASPLPDNKSSLELGTEVQTRLSGNPVTGGVIDFAPAINYYLKAHLFGYIFGRDNITESDREPATLSALSALEGTEGQLKSHLHYANG